MRTITALLFAGVVLTGGMAAMAADITEPEADAPALVEPERPDVITVPERPDIPVREEAVDPGPVDADVEAPDGPIDDVGDPVPSDVPDIPVREEAVDPDPVDGGADVTDDDVGDPVSGDVPDTAVQEEVVDPGRDVVDDPSEQCPPTRICDDTGVDPEAGCSREFCEQLNRAPVAVGDGYVVETSASPVVLPVIENDFDPDEGDIVTIVGNSSSTLGDVACNHQGTSCNFIPGQRAGTATFEYTVSDGELEASASVTVSIVNRTPEPLPDTFEVNRGGDPIELDVLSNDSDPDGDVLTIVGNGAPTAGAVECGPTSCSFTPGSETGTATFEYVVSDGNAEARALVTVDLVNRGPVAVDDDFTVQLTEGNVTLPLVANDSDPDGDALTIVGDPTFILGTLDCGTTSCEFVHAGSPGTATFEYTVTDGVASASATVIVRVPEPPPSEPDPSREPPDPTQETPDPTREAPDPTQEPPVPTGDTPDPPRETPVPSEDTPVAPETTLDAPETTDPVPETDTTPEPPATTGNVPSSSNQPPTSTTIDQPAERRIVRLPSGAVANSAPTSGSALSLVSAFWLLAPIAALLRRRRHDPSDIQIPGE